MLCAVCKHAIFDAQLGEYKCGQTGLYTGSSVISCFGYTKGTPQESKANGDYYRDMEDE